jgi:hypothetical protein
MNGFNLNAYKAVIALNNAGVDLMHRRLFDEGAETLKDALRLMRNTFCNSEESIPRAEELDRVLQAAYHRTSMIPKGMVPENTVRIALITDHDNPYEVFHQLERNAGTVFCVKIDPVDCFCGDDTDRLEIESAFLLYNYGIAHLFAAPSMYAPCHLDLTKKAYQLLELAESIAYTHLPGSDRVDAPTSTLLVSMLITTGLFQLSSHSLERKWENQQKLECLLTSIMNLEMMFPQKEWTAAASA